jgi:hypothetical protein
MKATANPMSQPFRTAADPGVDLEFCGMPGPLPIIWMRKNQVAPDITAISSERIRSHSLFLLDLTYFIKIRIPPV